MAKRIPDGDEATYKSMESASDGTHQWTSLGPPGQAISRLAINPRNPNIIYAGTLGGVFKSVDGGAHWQAANTGLANTFVRALAIDPVNANTLYAGTSGVPMGMTTYEGSGVYKSTDGGAHWEDVTAGLRKLAIHASIAASYNRYRDRIWIRREGNEAVIEFTGPGDTAFLDSEGRRHLALGPEVREMTDQAILEHFIKGEAERAARGSADDLGVFTQVLSLAVDPLNPATVYAGVDHGGIFKSTDGGTHWQAANTGLGFVLSIVIDPRTTSTVYAASPVFKSTDGGASWQAADNGLGNAIVLAIAIAPTDPTTLFAGAVPTSPTGPGGGIYKSTDGGARWLAVKSGLAADAAVGAVAIDPLNPAVVYAAVGSGGTGTSTVYRSTNCGAHWEEVNVGLDPGAQVGTLAVDPLNPAIVYAGTANGVFKKVFGSSPNP